MRKPPLASLPDHSTKNTSCGILLAFILLSGLSFRLACPYFAMLRLYNSVDSTRYKSHVSTIN